MGVARWLMRGTTAFLFFIAAWLSFSMGVQLNESQGTSVESLVYKPLAKGDLRRAILDSLGRNDKIQSQELSKRLAILSPMDPLPYEVALTVAIDAGEETDANHFAERTLVLQPRSLPARLHLLRVSSRDLKPQQIFKQYERLIELRSLDEQLLSEALVGVFREANDWSPLIRYLEGDPPSGGSIVDQMLAEDQFPVGFNDVMRRYPSKQAAYLRRVFAELGFEAAKSNWHSISDSIEQDQTIVFNPTFQFRSEPPPFNWSIHYDRAEIQSVGGLFISLSGVRDQLIARQIIAAPQGEYRLDTELLGGLPKSTAVLEWRLYCGEEKAPLLRSEMTFGGSPQKQFFMFPVSIPDAGCAYQVLELHARAGKEPMSSRIEVLSVSLDEVVFEGPR